MRVLPVTTRGENAVSEVIEFYMGKNTAERRQYIMVPWRRATPGRTRMILNSTI